MKPKVEKFVNAVIENIRQRHSIVDVEDVYRTHSRGTSLKARVVSFTCEVHGPQSLILNSERCRTSQYLIEDEVCQTCKKVLRQTKSTSEICKQVRNLIWKRHCEGRGPNVKLLSCENGSIKLRCPVHGIFEESLTKFQNNMRWTCRECSKQKTREDSVSRGKETFEQTFSYLSKKYGWVLLDPYYDSSTRLRCVCPAHGEFLLLPNNLLGRNRHCCPKGGLESRNKGLQVYDIHVINTLVRSKGITCVEHSGSVGKNSKFMCDKGHEWYAPAYSIINDVTGCPKCSRGNISKLEHALFNELKPQVPDLVQTYRLKKKNATDARSHLSLDLFSKEKLAAVEVNGWYWHSSAAAKRFPVKDPGKYRTRHLEKWRACVNEGIRLIQIWDNLLPNKEQAYRLLLEDHFGLLPGVLISEVTHSKVKSRKARRWLDAHHIQGSPKIDGVEYEGLVDTDGNILALVAYVGNELVRFARTVSISYGPLLRPRTKITLNRNYWSTKDFEPLGFRVRQQIPPKRILINDAEAYNAGYDVMVNW